MQAWIGAAVPALLLALLHASAGLEPRSVGEGDIETLARDDFPRAPEFVFGAGTSSFQYEGATSEDGRKPSIWDVFTHQGKMADKSRADVTADGYHKFREDVEYMREMGLEAYRFSICWSRLIPDGRGAVNPLGLEYYNKVIDALLEHGIEPHVTLFHLDFPLALEEEYGGWLNTRVVNDFTSYADVCFREFGDRVRHWTTVNEPNVVVPSSYDNGIFPPERCTNPFGATHNCSRGNSSTEPYIVMHNTILAHASAVHLYRTKYQHQKGSVGFNMYSMWLIPYTNSESDETATHRALDFTVGWTLKPLISGDYPTTMRKAVGSRLPCFTPEQSKQVKGSLDFLGINHYTAIYIQDGKRRNKEAPTDYYSDMSVNFAVNKNDTPTPQLFPVGLPASPEGLLRMLVYLKEEYGIPAMYIHENGLGTSKNSTTEDPERIDAIKGYIAALHLAIRNGCNMKGYIVWSLLDMFEYLTGYESRYGLYYVDFEDINRKRTPKMSAFWYGDFLKTREIGGRIEIS